MSFYDHKIFKMASWYIEVYESGIGFSMSLFDFIQQGNSSLLPTMVLSLTGQRCRADIFWSVMVFFEFYLIIMDMVPVSQCFQMYT